MRARRKNKNRSSSAANRIDPATFTCHIAAAPPPSTWGQIVSHMAFSPPPSMKRRLLRALKRSAKRKASGADGIFTEALQISPLLSAQFLLALWRNCGELLTVPASWRRIILVPIHKKGFQTTLPTSGLSLYCRMNGKNLRRRSRCTCASRPSSIPFKVVTIKLV